MAVIESKGDGYSMFNGVKLPSLPEYDETEYPYALIMSCDEFDELSLYLMAEPLECVINEDGVNLFHNDLGTILRYNIVDNSWHFVERYRDALDVYQCEAYWTNTDIIDVESRTVYLSTSEPIPLDGMNVIEWDGDTTGLTDSGGYYKVTDTTDVDTSKECVFSVYRNSTASYISSQAALLPLGDSWLASNRLRYVPIATEEYPEQGCFFRHTATLYLALFAYYPIKEEPEDTESIGYIEYMVNPKYRMGNPFRGFFGWLWAKKHIGGGSDVAKYALVSSDGYTLQDVNGLNLIPKEGN